METAQTEARTRKSEPAADKPSDFPVKLLKNYMPKGDYTVIGYDKPAVMAKNAAGQMIEVSAAEFVKGENKPPMYPGTGFPGKVWAGTYISLPVDEARGLCATKPPVAERADAIPG